MLQQGKKATGESWRDNYITPQHIFDCVNAYSDSIRETGFFDPCPENPIFNGLERSWQSDFTNHKVVYINPPFSEYSSWLDKGIREYKISKELNQKLSLIYVCNTACEVKWYRRALANASVELRTNYRVKFIHPKTKILTSSPRSSNTFFYFGENKFEFVKAFKDQGYFLDLDTWRIQKNSLGL